MFTIAKRLLNPLTGVGVLPNFWSKASDILCAGSVDIISTLCLTCANWMAILQLKERETQKVFKMYSHKLV